MDVISKWRQEFDKLMHRLKSRFAHSQSRKWARAYLQGLLSNVPRKNGWQLAETVGATTPYGLQQFVYRAKWEADDIRDDLREYVVEVYCSDTSAPGVIEDIVTRTSALLILCSHSVQGKYLGFLRKYSRQAETAC